MTTFNRGWLLLFTSLAVPSISSSQLSVKGDGIYAVRPGYIDQATLVIDPHGAYVGQSLYLTYSDHNQFSPATQIEIVHRFQLPAGAVVNDMWLWIGDSLMKAAMYNTWTARHIYDSIVTSKRDPAFLSKIGDFYELRIYPLIPGKFRKVRLNFIVPTRWFGENGSAELPLRLLKDNNALVKPLQVQFSQTDPVWGIPRFIELPQSKFTTTTDSTGFTYQYSNIADVSTLASLTLGYATSFAAGYFFRTNDVRNDATYFQIGFKPGTLFGLSVDSSSKRMMVALDLSGSHYKNFATLLPNVKRFLHAAAKSSDSITVVVAGAGSVQALNPTWKAAQPDTINAIIDRFEASDFGKSVSASKVLNIIYADAHASFCWQFPGLGDLATFQNYTNLSLALVNFSSADIIASYDHGMEAATATQANLSTILARVDSFFTLGGRFLSYYDHNRVGRELVGSHYIKGLTTSGGGARVSAAVYRNVTGNIGINFPESVVTHFFDCLVYDPDPDVKVELRDDAGRAVVISKKIGNGLLVVSGIWSFSDDAGLRTMLGVPLLGLNAASPVQQLTDLLTDVRSRYTQSQFKSVYLLSNGDSLVQKSAAQNWTTTYFAGYVNSKPVFNTINLLDGSGFIPPYVSDNQVDYYGSGTLLKAISDASNGSHFETHIDSWDYINSALSAYTYPPADSLSLTIAVDNGTGKLNELREVNPVPKDPAKPRFFVGSTSNANRMGIEIKARFRGSVTVRDSSFSFAVEHDTLRMERILPAMLGFEKLKDKFNAGGADTAGIVNLAIKYNLLTDYTALLVLEPKDTTANLNKPPGDIHATDVPRYTDESAPDSLTFETYPNPFNNRTNLVINANKRFIVTVCVYNILGQLVKVVASNEPVVGRRVFSWNGDDESKRTVNSGVYFVRLIAKEARGGKSVSQIRKIVFMK